MWPGFGDNSRVLKWIMERVEGGGEAVDTPIGKVPAPGAIDMSGIEDEVSDETMSKLLEVHPELWDQEVALIRAHYATFGDRLPPRLNAQLDALEARLKAAL